MITGRVRQALDVVTGVVLVGFDSPSNGARPSRRSKRNETMAKTERGGRMSTTIQRADAIACCASVVPRQLAATAI